MLISFVKHVLLLLLVALVVIIIALSCCFQLRHTQVSVEHIYAVSIRMSSKYIVIYFKLFKYFIYCQYLFELFKSFLKNIANKYCFSKDVHISGFSRFFREETTPCGYYWHYEIWHSSFTPILGWRNGRCCCWSNIGT